MVCEMAWPPADAVMLTFVEPVGVEVLKFRGVGTGEFGIVIVAGMVTNCG